MMKPELVIFDCDGVLIDSEHLALQALVETLAGHGVSLTLPEAIERYMGRNSVYEKADIESRYQIKLAFDHSEKKRVHREKLFEEKLKMTPGLSDFLAVLPYKKCVASNSSLQRLRHSLGLVGLWERFAPHIFSSEQVPNGKPAPDIYLFAAKQMKVDPSACLVIEDSVLGVQAAKAANMKVYGFTGGSHCGAGHDVRLLQEGAEKVFAHMHDVAEILELSSQFS